MKNPDRNTVSQLESLPNIGGVMAGDLRKIGIQYPSELRGKIAYRLYGALFMITGKRHDPCVIDVFLSAIDFMEGGQAKPWWKYTAVRTIFMTGPSVSCGQRRWSIV